MDDYRLVFGYSHSVTRCAALPPRSTRGSRRAVSTLVLATHWHDDHINGLNQIVEACRNAKFACSGAMGAEAFKTLTDQYGAYLQHGGSGVDEFREILKILGRRATQGGMIAPVLASSGKNLYRRSGPLPVIITAYSLSDAAVATMITRFQTNLRPIAEGKKLKVPDLGPNEGSVVIAVELGASTLMLGADLEEEDPSKQGFGWTDVLANFAPPTAPFEGFKIPHHGSQNGYHPEVWPRFMHGNAWAVVTPYAQGRKPLPSVEDVIRIKRMCPAATSVTALPHLRKFKHQLPEVQKTILELGVTIFDEPSRQGHVRLRKDITRQSAAWTTEFFGDAQPLR